MSKSYIVRYTFRTSLPWRKSDLFFGTLDTLRGRRWKYMNFYLHDIPRSGAPRFQTRRRAAEFITADVQYWDECENTYPPGYVIEEVNEPVTFYACWVCGKKRNKGRWYWHGFVCWKCWRFSNTKRKMNRSSVCEFCKIMGSHQRPLYRVKILRYPRPYIARFHERCKASFRSWWGSRHGSMRYSCSPVERFKKMVFAKR